MNEVTLTDKQLLLLANEPQFAALAEAARQRLAATEAMEGLNDAQRNLVGKVIEYARTEKIVNFRYSSTSMCRICNKTAGYAKYQRSTRSHRKGEIDWSKPLHMNGIEFGKSYVMNHISLGGCTECVNDAVISAIRQLVADIECEVDPVLSLPGRKNLKRFANCKCKCGWTGHEGELYRLQSIMGNGYYPGKCPGCGAENVLFDTPIKTTDGYTLIVVPRKIAKTTQYPPQTYEANIDTVSVRPVDWATYKSADGLVVIEW